MNAISKIKEKTHCGQTRIYEAIDRLINVHSRLIKEGFAHKIFVVGTGPLKEKLEEQNKSMVEESLKKSEKLEEKPK